MISAPKKTTSYDRAAMRELVTAEIVTLKQIDLSTLRGLPARTVQCHSGEAAVTINQYHEASKETGEHTVVVQASRDPGFGFWAHSEIDGFVTARDGTQRCLTSKEKLRYS